MTKGQIQEVDPPAQRLPSSEAPPCPDAPMHLGHELRTRGVEAAVSRPESRRLFGGDSDHGTCAKISGISKEPGPTKDSAAEGQHKRQGKNVDVTVRSQSRGHSQRV